MKENDGANLFKHRGVSTYVDQDGFILHPEEWSRHMAEALADADGIEDLTVDHWKVMSFVRDYWQGHAVAPMIRLLCKETGFNLSEIYELFPALVRMNLEP